MSFAAILLLAIGLAMDATAVSAARGLRAPRIRARDAVTVALVFGGLQAAMPVLGWLVGAELGPVIRDWDHWIAFGLLAAIGGKMLWEARGTHDPEARRGDDPPFAIVALLVLGVATSIDALAVGFTLPLLGAPLGSAVLTIGLTTAALSVAGLYAGRRLGALLGPRLDLLGGLVLIGLGAKILIEHLAAA